MGGSSGGGNFCGWLSGSLDRRGSMLRWRVGSNLLRRSRVSGSPRGRQRPPSPPKGGLFRPQSLGGGAWPPGQLWSPLPRLDLEPMAQRANAPNGTAERPEKPSGTRTWGRKGTQGITHADWTPVPRVEPRFSALLCFYTFLNQEVKSYKAVHAARKHSDNSGSQLRFSRAT